MNLNTQDLLAWNNLPNANKICRTDFCSITPNQSGLPTVKSETTLVKSLKIPIAVLLRSKSGTIYQAQVCWTKPQDQKQIIKLSS